MATKANLRFVRLLLGAVHCVGGPHTALYTPSLQEGDTYNREKNLKNSPILLFISCLQGSRYCGRQIFIYLILYAIASLQSRSICTYFANKEKGHKANDVWDSSFSCSKKRHITLRQERRKSWQWLQTGDLCGQCSLQM